MIFKESHTRVLKLTLCPPVLTFLLISMNLKLEKISPYLISGIELSAK